MESLHSMHKALESVPACINQANRCRSVIPAIGNWQEDPKLRVRATERTQWVKVAAVQA